MPTVKVFHQEDPGLGIQNTPRNNLTSYLLSGKVGAPESDKDVVPKRDEDPAGLPIMLGIQR
jgi:hypothetical protein